MAEMATELYPSSIKARQSKGVRGMKKHGLKIDMTPMVDLGFLLIAFFIITTELTRPASLKLNMPHDGTGSKVASSNAMTVLIDEAGIFYYHGEWEIAKRGQQVFRTDISFNNGLGNHIRQKQASLDESHPGGEGRKGLMLLIKPTETSYYKDLVDVIDQVLVNGVDKYAILKPDGEEINFLALIK